jgi:hypothetical protein
LTIAFGIAYNPVSPTVVLRVPTIVGACDNLTVDTTLSAGQAGRPWRNVFWSMSALTGGTSADLSSSLITTFIQNLGSQSMAQQFTLLRSLFSIGRYSLTLTLTNWFGLSSSVAAAFLVDGNMFVPKLTIAGASIRTIKANQVLTFYSKASFSSCTSSVKNTKLLYSWTLLLEGQSIYFTSTSKDPSVLSLPAYSLSASMIYFILVNATVMQSNIVKAQSSARVQVTVSSGSLVAQISGSSTRQVALDSTAVLVATTSYDENSLTSSHLRYSWSCFVSSMDRYGEDCTTVFGQLSTTTGIAVVLGSTLNMSTSYHVLLTLSSALAGDLRIASTSITIAPIAIGSPFTSISASSSKFNIDSNFSISGTVQAIYDLSTQWTALISGQEVSFSTFTNQRRDITRSNMISSPQSLTLLIDGSSFLSGSSVTFRLKASLRSTSQVSLSSYSELTLIANSAPSGGTTIVVPPSGNALSTSFLLQSIDWSDDPSDFPLSFGFKYALSAESTAMTIQGRSSSSSITSNFPAGLVSQDHVLLVSTFVFDIYSASNQFVTNATVFSSPTSYLNVFLSNGLQTAFASNDGNSVFQTMNIAASTLSLVNCTATQLSYCASLNRGPCVSTINTCGSCLTGYFGVVGDSNFACTNLTSMNSPVGKLGDRCLADSQCVFGYCSNETCTIPLKTCLSSDSTHICSGHGNCVFVADNGVLIENCFQNDVYCYAHCTCSDGYGGSDCSLNSTQLSERDIQRTTLCWSLLEATTLSTSSSDLLDTLSASLTSLYNADEVVSDNGTAVCYEALYQVTTLAAQGYLSSASGVTAQLLVQAVSQYIAGEFRRNASQANSSLTSALNDVSSGVLNALVDGQDAVKLVSSYFRLAASRPLSSTLIGSTFSPPPTSEEATYEIAGPTVELVSEDVVKSLTGNNGYSQLSIAQFGVNPFPNAATAHSSLLRFSARSGPTTSTLETTGSIAFYLTMQFSQLQSFNLSITPIDINTQSDALPVNETFPQCGYYDSESYKDCGSCQVASYSNYNITFACYNVSDLLSTAQTTRRLQQIFTSQSVLLEAATSNNLDSPTERTRLFAALFVAIATSFSEVLTSNPFALNWKEGKSVFVFVATLLVLFIWTAVYFARIDERERLQFIYRSQWPPKQNSKGFSQFLPTKLRLMLSAQARRKRREMQSQNTAKFQEALRRLEFEGIESKNAVDNFNTSHSCESSILSSNIFEFLEENVLPELLRSPNYFVVATRCLLCVHEWSATFYRPSRTHPRLLRWMDWCKSLMLGIFVDTLFFQIFYTNDGSCELATSEAMCLSALNAVTGSSKCSWSSVQFSAHNSRSKQSFWCLLLLILISLFTNLLGYISCTMAPPPQDPNFTIILSLCTLLIAVPIDLMLNVILDEVCAKRPTLEKLGWNAEYWIGRSHRHFPTGDNKRDNGDDDDQVIVQSQPVANRQNESRNNIIKISTDLGYGQLTRSSEACSIDDSVWSDTPSTQAVSVSLWRELQTVEEESSSLLHLIVQEHFRRETIKSYDNEFIHDCEEEEMQTESGRARWAARSRALALELGVRSDGTFRPVTVIEKLCAGSANTKNGILRIHHKLAKVRRQAEKINEENAFLEYRQGVTRAAASSIELSPEPVFNSQKSHSIPKEIFTNELGGSEPRDMEADVMLLNSFVLEQFTRFQRWLLRDQLKLFEPLQPEPISPIAWLLGWFVVLGIMMFFFYWILAWGASSGRFVLKAWGWNFALQTIQELFLIQFCKVFLVFVITIQSLRPQLVRINNVLQGVALELLVKQESALHHLSQTEKSAGLSLVQFLSPTVRAAVQRQRELKINESDPRKHSEPKKVTFLDVLINVNDLDTQRCRSTYSTIAVAEMSLLSFFILILSATLALFGDVAAGLAMDIMLPTTSAIFLLINSVIASSSALALIIIYVLFFSYFLHRMVLLPWATERSLIRKQLRHRQRDGDILYDQIRERGKQLDQQVVSDHVAIAANSNPVSSKIYDDSLESHSILTTLYWIINTFFFDFFAYVAIHLQSHILFKKFEKNNKECLQNWSMMNIPSYVNSASATTDEHVSVPIFDNSKLNTPVQILMMRRIEMSPLLEALNANGLKNKPENDYLTQVLQRSLFAVPTVSETQEALPHLKFSLFR